MALRSRRQVILAAVVTMVAAPALACRAPWAKVQEDVTQYVKDVRDPMARLSEWLASLNAFYSDVRAGDMQEVACASGRLTALIDEGTAAVAALDAVEAPAAVASVHDSAVDGAKSVVDKLIEVRKLACESGDLAAGQEALEEFGSAIESAPDWLGKLSSWLAER